MKFSFMAVVLLSASPCFGYPVHVPRVAPNISKRTTAAAAAAAAVPPPATWNPVAAVVGSIAGALTVMVARKIYELAQLHHYYEDRMDQAQISGNSTEQDIEHEKWRVYEAVLRNPTMLPTSPNALVAYLDPPNKQPTSTDATTNEAEKPAQQAA